MLFFCSLLAIFSFFICSFFYNDTHNLPATNRIDHVSKRKYINLDVDDSLVICMIVNKNLL